MWCFELLELLEFGLSVELPFVDANVCAANVKVSCLVVGTLRCVRKREFDVNCRCLLGAREGVRVRCDVMLLEELFPLLMVARVT